jgi:hypothetical protein
MGLREFQGGYEDINGLDADERYDNAPQAIDDEVALQHDPAEAQEKPKQLVHRGHGGALPQ